MGWRVPKIGLLTSSHATAWFRDKCLETPPRSSCGNRLAFPLDKLLDPLGHGRKA